MPDLLENTECNFCGGSSTRLLLCGTDRYYVSVPPDVWCGVVKCELCGLIYLNPRVKEEHIGIFYPSDEYYTRNQTSQARQLRRLKDDLHYLASHKYLGYPAENIRRTGIGQKRQRFLVPLIFWLFRGKFRRILPFQPGGRMLDFGFGSGGYLLRMKDLGWESWGVEIDSQSVKSMNEIGVRAFHNLWDLEIPNDYFDHVIAYHSIEHVFDPKAVLKRLQDIIKPGGKIHMGVPNFNSFAGRAFRGYWDNLGVPIHPYVFTTASATKYLKDAGFRNISVRYASYPEGLLGSLQFWLNSWVWRLSGKKCTWLFLRRSILGQVLLYPIVKVLDLFRMGDCIELIGEKK